MTRIEAPSRLHLGLLSLPVIGQESWANGSPKRLFGGVGLMLESPSVLVRISPSSEWSAVGSLETRALGFAKKFVATLPSKSRKAFHIEVERSPDEHVGLGCGTALGLSIAKAIAMETAHPDLTAIELARRVGRGQRSAIGIHGFEQGGLIVEAGKLPGEDVGHLIGRFAFPADWRIVLVRPRETSIWHGRHEHEAFSRLPRNNPTEALCRIVITGLLPALAAGDLDAFGEAVYEFNIRASEGFMIEQGGNYAVPEMAKLAHQLRHEGVKGVGQSSWGPTLFAIVRDEIQAGEIIRSIPSDLSICLTRSAQRGALVEVT